MTESIKPTEAFQSQIQTYTAEIRNGNFHQTDNGAGQLTQKQAYIAVPTGDGQIEVTQVGRSIAKITCSAADLEAAQNSGIYTSDLIAAAREVCGGTTNTYVLSARNDLPAALQRFDSEATTGGIAYKKDGMLVLDESNLGVTATFSCNKEGTGLKPVRVDDLSPMSIMGGNPHQMAAAHTEIDTQIRDGKTKLCKQAPKHD